MKEETEEKLKEYLEELIFEVVNEAENLPSSDLKDKAERAFVHIRRMLEYEYTDDELDQDMLSYKPDDLY